MKTASAHNAPLTGEIKFYPMSEVELMKRRLAREEKRLEYIKKLKNYKEAIDKIEFEDVNTILGKIQIIKNPMTTMAEEFLRRVNKVKTVGRGTVHQEAI